MSEETLTDSEVDFNISEDEEYERPRDDPLEEDFGDEGIDEGTEIREVKPRADIGDILRTDVDPDPTLHCDGEDVIPDDRVPLSDVDEDKARVKHHKHHRRQKPSEVLSPDEFAYRLEILHRIKRYITEFPDDLRDYEFDKIRDIIDVEVLERIEEGIDQTLSAFSGEKTFKEMYFMGTEYMEQYGISHGWKVKDFSSKLRYGKTKDGGPTENQRVLTRCAIKHSSMFRSNALVQLGINTVQAFTHYHGYNKMMERVNRNDKPVSKTQYEAFQDL